MNTQAHHITWLRAHHITWLRAHGACAEGIAFAKDDVMGEVCS
jgi:hypothetical protein